jgi:hypothetical protein
MARFRFSLREAPALGAVVAGLALAAACQPAATDDRNRSEATISSTNEIRVIDRKNPVLTAPVPSAPESARRKFVVVQIAKVENPREVPLTFAVSFRPAAGHEQTLGTFSLYPADHPGRFLVATQGKVAPGGAIALRIEGEAAEADDIRVSVGTITLAEE